LLQLPVCVECGSSLLVPLLALCVECVRTPESMPVLPLCVKCGVCVPVPVPVCCAWSVGPVCLWHCAWSVG